MVFYIAKETGWSFDAIKQMPLATLQAMMSDAPRTIRKSQQKRAFNSDEELIAFLTKETKYEQNRNHRDTF